MEILQPESFKRKFQYYICKSINYIQTLGLKFEANLIHQNSFNSDSKSG